jgi:isocitrate lyase
MVVKRFVMPATVYRTNDNFLSSDRQCGHLGGKVLVPTSTHTSRLISARFQLDLLKSTMLLIARTDAESAKLISSTVDVDDHEFVLGTTTKDHKGLAQVLAEAEARGASGVEIDKLEREWTESHEICTFNQGEVFDAESPRRLSWTSCLAIAVERAINRSNISDKVAVYENYLASVSGRSNNEAREIAKDLLGESVFWDWDRE